MKKIGYRLTDITDPEERLEEAAMWKAMKDVYGDTIAPLAPGERAPKDWVLFGRGPDTGQEPVSSRLRYWEDRAFLDLCGRRFETVPFEGLEDAVARLHADGLSAFVKSTRLKHHISRVPVGSTAGEVLGYMAFSFMDGGPQLMVQEECDVRFEYRFFVVDRRIVTSSPVEHSLTPIDHPLPYGMLFEKPAGGMLVFSEEIADSHFEAARLMAEAMEGTDAVVDVALVNGHSAVLELNPMQIGQAGLYASSVRELAAVSADLVARHMADWRPAPEVEAEEIVDAPFHDL